MDLFIAENISTSHCFQIIRKTEWVANDCRWFIGFAPPSARYPSSGSHSPIRCRTRHGHHPAAHDLRHVAGLSQFDLDPGLLGSAADELGGCLAVRAARTRHLDIFYAHYLFTIVSITAAGVMAATGVVAFQLHRRTRHSAVGAEHAAVALQRLKEFPATLAFVVPLAGVGRHSLFSDMTAFWTGDAGLQNDCHAIARFLMVRGQTL
jgi:hypothetical protein